jgi:general secretion pathway protein G
MNNKFKKAFSLIELIFIIALIAIISSIAIPNLTNITTKANVSSIKQDINTIITSCRSYYLINNKLDNISDAVNLDSSIWDISSNKIVYKEGSNECIDIILNNNKLELSIKNDAGEICTKLSTSGISNTTYSLN